MKALLTRILCTAAAAIPTRSARREAEPADQHPGHRQDHD